MRYRQCGLAICTFHFGFSLGRTGPTEHQLSVLAGIGHSGPWNAEVPSEELLAPWAGQIYRWPTVDIHGVIQKVKGLHIAA